MTRTVLGGATTFYVAKTGSDATGDGSACAPWATLQYAANFIQRYVDLGGYTATVQVAAGTYAAGVQALAPFVGGALNDVGGVVFSGDVADPDNVTIAASTLCFQASFGAKFAVRGFKLTTTAGDGLYASAGGNIYVAGQMEYGAVPTTQNGAHMHVTVGGSIVGTAPYKISGGGSIHFFADRGGDIEYNSAAVSLTGTPAFTGAFSFANDNGTLYNCGLSFSGAASGRRYYVQTGGLIQSFGTVYPGDAAGIADVTSFGIFK